MFTSGSKKIRRGDFTCAAAIGAQFGGPPSIRLKCAGCLMICESPILDGQALLMDERLVGIEKGDDWLWCLL